MRRRSLLALAGTTLAAGCSGLVPAASDRSTETVTPVPADETTVSATDGGTDNGDDRPTFDGRQVVDLGTGPRTLAVQGSNWGDDRGPVGLGGPDGGNRLVGFTATATADRPAVLRALLVNGNDWRNTFRLREFPPFGGVAHARLRRSGFGRHFEDRVSTDRETGLYLAPTANHDLVDEEPDTRRGPDGYWQTPDVPAEPPSTVTLAPGEVLTGEYHVLGHWDRAGFPTGTYRFGGRESGLALAAWDAEAPGPATDSRFSGPVPSLPGDREAGWYHEADASTRVYLEPDRERVAAPGELAFRLVNHSASAVGGNPYEWGLYKLAGGSWYKVAPHMIPMPASRVPPGSTYGYALAVFHGDGFDADDVNADLSNSVGRLGGGRYAFVGGFRPDDGPTPAAAFDLEAPAVPLSVADEAVVDEDGGRAVVTFPSWGDGDHPPDATLTVRRADGATDGTMIREVLARSRMRALESALAAIGDRDAAVVRADEHLVENVTGYESTSRRFAFEGTAFVAEADRSGDD